MTATVSTNSSGVYQVQRVLGQVADVALSVEADGYVAQSQTVSVPPSRSDGFRAHFPRYFPRCTGADL